MKNKSFIQTLKTTEYHPELVKMFLDTVSKGIISANIMIPLFYATIFIKFVPVYILAIWLSAHAITIYFRLKIKTSILKFQDNNNPKIKKYVQLNIYVIALSGLLWGVASIISVIYAPEFYMFLTMGLIMGLSAGAAFTLTPILHAFLSFVFSSIVPFICALFIFNSNEYFIIILMLLFFMTFVVLNGYGFYKKLLQNIELKHKFIKLNNNLEKEVANRTVQLCELNNSLEKRIRQEAKANRDKDSQLLQQSRLAQMGEMISMIAHQWRQPLSAISSTSINMKMKFFFDEFNLNDKEQQQLCKKYFEQQLDNIESYVQNLTTTIDDFRNFYKPNRGTKRVNVNEPIQKALSIIKDSINSSGVKVIETFKANIELDLFESELMQVFLNILKNAQDNFKEKDIENPYIKIITANANGGVRIVFRDNGGGIDKNILVKIFDPYFSTKDEKNGTGLGLYMSKIIVEEHHNGKLYVENIDDGVQFVVEFRDKI